MVEGTGVVVGFPVRVALNVASAGKITRGVGVGTPGGRGVRVGLQVRRGTGGTVMAGGQVGRLLLLEGVPLMQGSGVFAYGVRVKWAGRAVRVACLAVSRMPGMRVDEGAGDGVACADGCGVPVGSSGEGVGVGVGVG